MRVALSVVVGLMAGMLTGSLALAGPDDGGGGPPLIPGSRQVHIRNSSGGIGVYTSIPSGSTFRSHGGGAAAECEGVAEGDDPATLDIVEDQRPVRSTKWIFIEGIAVVIDLPIDLEAFDPTGPSLHEVTRTFSVYCVDTFYSANFKGLIEVAATDPMLDPRGQISDLYNGLQLDPIVVYENKVVGEWGGLVVRSPAWLAINGSAWRTQRSNVQYYRGWELYLITVPTSLDFVVEFVPDPERPTDPFSGTIPCVDSEDDLPRDAGLEFPYRPAGLADFAEPGSGQPCEWTPPGPGEVTITARQTFAVTFWASGAVEPQPDYVWQSEPTTFRVGELVAVNVND